MAMARIFVNYRNNDAHGEARALRHGLTRAFGEDAVSFDAAVIAPGEPWPQRLRDELERATVLLAVIANAWLTQHDEVGRGTGRPKRRPQGSPTVWSPRCAPRSSPSSACWSWSARRCC
jgi:hypothetical protein